MNTHLRALRSVSVALCVALLAAACGSPNAAPTQPPAPAAPTGAQVVQPTQAAAPATKVIDATVQNPNTTPLVTAAPTAANAPATSGKKGGTLIMARAADAKGLDPHTNTAFTSFRIFELVYNTLVRLDKDLKVQPELAESWTTSDDGKTITFKLRKGVKFHNGDTLTANDVKYTFGRIMDEKTAAAARSTFADVTDVQASDDNTVVFTLKGPNAGFVTALTTYNASIVSQKVASSKDISKLEGVVGTGPFKLVSWTPDSMMKLEANKDFFIPGQPVLDGIEIRIIPDESSILAGLRSKTIDFAIVNDPKVAQTISKTQGIALTRTPDISYHVFGLNAKRKPFDDVRVRQAISCAIDRQEIIDVAALGEGKITGPLTQPFYQLPASQLPCYKQDLDKAKKLLSDANASNISFKIMAATSEPATAIAEAQDIQAQLKKVGINAEIEPLELNTYVDRWLKADMDSWVGLNGSNPDPNITLFRYWHSTGNLQKIAAISSPEMDKLLEQGRAEPNPDKRKPIYNQIETMLADQAPWIWTYVGSNYWAAQPTVKGFTGMPSGSIIYLREASVDK